MPGVPDQIHPTPSLSRPFILPKLIPPTHPTNNVNSLGQKLLAVAKLGLLWFAGVLSSLIDC